jgi:Ser/Thr protein kinase RdoA (MazF antagonist)
VELGPRIAYGREAEVYVNDVDDRTVVKLYRPGYDGHVAEAAALAGLAGAHVAPRLVGTVRVGERDGVVLQRLDGVDMLTLLQRQPWRLLRLARLLAQAALRIHRIPAPSDLPDLVELLRERIVAADLDARLREFALRVLDTLPAGDRLCHGDFHPGNAVVDENGASIIDWAAATRGVPAADFARTLLLLRQADPLPGTPWMFRVLLSAGRSAFANAYARSYRNGTADPLPRLEAWTLVHTAARLAEGIDAERVRLVGVIEAAYHADAQGRGRYLDQART